MSAGVEGERTLVVDASVLITLAAVEAVDLLVGADGEVVVPRAVQREVTSEPARAALTRERDAGRIDVVEPRSSLENAAAHLGRAPGDEAGGDVELLAFALATDGAVAVTDDKPLRTVCKTLSVPVSGSIGVLVRAVERGDVPAEAATDALYAMDEVGARLSASLVRRAERLIEDAAGE